MWHSSCRDQFGAPHLLQSAFLNFAGLSEYYLVVLVFVLLICRIFFFSESGETFNFPYMYSCNASVIASTDMSLVPFIFLRSQWPDDLQMKDKNVDVRSSAAVIVQIRSFSSSMIHFQTSAADSPSSRFRSKKSALLCKTFLSGVNCSQNSVYSLYNRSELGSLSSTVFVISVIAFCPFAQKNMSFISVFIWSRSVLWQYLFIVRYIDRSKSFVISVYSKISATTCLYWCSLALPKLEW